MLVTRGVTLTATLSDGAEGVGVGLLKDGVQWGPGVNTDSSGVATFQYSASEAGTATLQAVANHYDPSNTVDVTAVTVTMQAKRKSDSEWAEGNVTVAAGALANAAHQADVLIQASPAVPATLHVLLNASAGHDTSAALEIGGAALSRGVWQEVDTDDSGALSGVLTSSDLIGDEAGVFCGGRSRSVHFAWDNYPGDDQWVSDPFYIVPGGESTQTLILKVNNVGLRGHNIRFFVEKIEYEDDDGNAQTPLYNTVQSPSDLSAWASFANPDGTVSPDGTVTVTLSMEDKPEMTSITMRAYDLTVWTE